MTARHDWDALAAREPYFSVLTDPRFLSARWNAEAERAFFEGGREEVRRLVDELARRRRNAPLRSVLEFGCGPGRLALAFAERGLQVTAVDASAGMLRLARERAAREGLSIRFLTPAELAASDDTFDLVNARLVFQHIAPRDGYGITRDLLRRISLNGVAVLQFPYAQRASLAQRALHAARGVRAINAAINLLRGKPAATPLFDAQLYDLGALLDLFTNTPADVLWLEHERQPSLDAVTWFVARPLRSEPKVPDYVPPERGAGWIDVRELMARSSIDELNRKAEDYFRSLERWDEVLAKPFANAADAPPLLINVATLIHGLRLVPGLTVLDFGAGSGWLSRCLTQLGCRVLVVDVSDTALRMARELYARNPPFGDQPAPEFLRYDGVTLPVPDGSVDRIVCFDAFHHSPNPGDVLREFARVLVPGGIAGFSEPGPHHSDQPQSQFEMRTYGVVENDVDLDALWRGAAQAGFTALEVAVFNARPFRVTLDEYDDLLRGGPTAGQWTVNTIEFLRNVRDFFLIKGGLPEVDSRFAAALRAELAITLASARVPAGGRVTAHARVTNRGEGRWLPSAADPGGVNVGCHLYDASGALLHFDWRWLALGEELIAAGESVERTFEFDAPQDAGDYILEFDCTARRVSWFAQSGGSTPVRCNLTVV